MYRTSIVAALLLLWLSAPAHAQNGALRIIVTLPDESKSAVPIAAHALLISDNPPTREPRRVVTRADGAVVINLAPGSYVVESDRPAAFRGQGYEWVTFVEVTADGETVLALTEQNAKLVPVTADAPETGASGSRDVLAQVAKWQSSVVTIWSPTAQGSGFVIDARGLIATDRQAVGTATSVEVQLSPALKVPARVLVAEPTQNVAIAWIDPAMLDGKPPIPVNCQPASSPAVDDGDEVVAITASPDGSGDVVSGEVTGFHPRGVESDLRLAFGEAGGPVFSAADVGLVGLTSARTDEDARRGDVWIVRAGILCEAVLGVKTKMSGAPPAPTKLPVEPARSANGSTSESPRSDSVPVTVSSPNFDVTVITPAAIIRARERADWTGGRKGRTPEAEARLGRLADFGSWAEYFADLPPVLIVRVTPKLVEGFWMRLAREAARTQGAELPALKDFKTNFGLLRASCGGNDVTPIHPFVLEHPVGGKRVLREGLYVFGLDAFGPHCGNVAFSVASEQAPEKPETVAIDVKLLEAIWQDVASYRQRP